MAPNPSDTGELGENLDIPESTLLHPTLGRAHPALTRVLGARPCDGRAATRVSPLPSAAHHVRALSNVSPNPPERQLHTAWSIVVLRS